MFLKKSTLLCLQGFHRVRTVKVSSPFNRVRTFKVSSSFNRIRTFKVSSSFNRVRTFKDNCCIEYEPTGTVSLTSQKIIIHSCTRTCKSAVANAIHVNAFMCLTLVRHRPVLGECVASFASTFPVAFLEPTLNKHNKNSVLFGIEEDMIATHSLEAKGNPPPTHSRPKVIRHSLTRGER